MEQTAKPAEAPKPKSKTMWIVAAVIIAIIVIAGAYYAFFMGKSANISILDDSACASGATACKFNPTSFSTTSGGTVVWKNNGGVTHTVHSCTSGNGITGTTQGCPTGLNTGAAASLEIAHTITTGDTFSQVFNSAGTYHYFCSLHPWMTGTVTVP